MSAEEIPQEVKNLIHDHLESVVQLESLLLLHTDPHKEWTAADVAKELRIEPAWASEQLNHLCDRGLLSCRDAGEASGVIYRYGPRAPELDRAVGGLANAYADRRVSVITLIFSKPVDKLKSFSDAFKIRRDPPRGS